MRNMEIAVDAEIHERTVDRYLYKGYSPPLDKLRRILEALGSDLVEFAELVEGRQCEGWDANWHGRDLEHWRREVKG